MSDIYLSDLIIWIIIYTKDKKTLELISQTFMERLDNLFGCYLDVYLGDFHWIQKPGTFDEKPCLSFTFQ